jgi:hypothetical protein
LSAAGTEVSRPRALPFVLVGVFAALLLGGIALSLSSAPSIAQQQLQSAAKTTAAASGYELVDTNSVTPLAPGAAANGQGPETIVFRVLYTAPAAVEETEAGPGGTTMAIILIGSRRFQGNGTQFTELPASEGAGPKAVGTIMAPLRAAADATRVTRHGDVYEFVPPDVGKLLTSILGVRAARLSSPYLTAAVHDGVVSHMQIGAKDGSVRLGVDLVFSAVGTAPPVTAPPPSSLVPSSSSGAATTP